MMKHMRTLALSVLPLCALSAPGLCQDAKSPAGSVNWSVAAPEKPTLKKKKSAGQPTAALSSADADKASRLEEGRKKFFGQSSGFDHSTIWDKTNMNVGAGGGTSSIPGESGGSKPGLGFGF